MQPRVTSTARLALRSVGERLGGAGSDDGEPDGDGVNPGVASPGSVGAAPRGGQPVRGPHKVTREERAG